MRGARLLGVGAAGITVGLAFAWWSSRPPPPLELHFVASGRLIASSFREEDQHLIRTWLVPGSIADVKTAASRELSEREGWQPPTLRSNKPEIVQFVRVHSPQGDFQFVRILLSQAPSGQVSVVLEEGPRQSHAFR